MKKLTKIFLTIITLALSLSPFVLSTAAFATNSAPSCGQTYGGVTINCPDEKPIDTGSSGKDAGATVTQIISYVMWIIGVVSVLMVIIGGIMYASAAGDESKTAKARKVIIGAVVGLAITLLAFTITTFINSQIT
jgi:cytochrome bd-type quinol oxidase subunit 2